MTRINCVPVTELSGPHLVAEYRELPRVYALAEAAMLRGVQPDSLPQTYVLGTGHVQFFYARLGYVTERHDQLIHEMLRRGYKPTWLDVPLLTEFPKLWRRGWEPDEGSLALNRARIAERSRAR